MRRCLFFWCVISTLQTVVFDCCGARSVPEVETSHVEAAREIRHTRFIQEDETKVEATTPTGAEVHGSPEGVTAPAASRDGITEKEADEKTHKGSHKEVSPYAIQLKAARGAKAHRGSHKEVSPYAIQLKAAREIKVTRKPTSLSLKRQNFARRIRRDSNNGSAEPEPTSAPEPTSESESGPKDEPKADSSVEPEVTSEPEAEPRHSWPEPEPEWPHALYEWQSAWPLHTYGFASIFSLIGVVQLAELVRIICQRERKTPLKLSLMTLIILFSSIRATVLFASPYGLTGVFPPMATRLLSSIGQPCILAAVSLLLLVLIDTTKMDIAPPRFQSLSFIVPIITLHVLLVVASDVIVAHFLEVKFLLLLCQLYFLITGLALTLGYACVGWKISRNVASNVNQSGSGSRDGKMNKLRHLIFAFTITSAMLLAVTVYGAAGVFGIYSNVIYVDAWPWWFLQTAFRCLETAMCLLLLIMNMNTSASRSSALTAWTRCCFRHSRVGASTLESSTRNKTLPRSSTMEPITSIR